MVVYYFLSSYLNYDNYNDTSKFTFLQSVMSEWGFMSKQCKKVIYGWEKHRNKRS